VLIIQFSLLLGGFATAVAAASQGGSYIVDDVHLLLSNPLTYLVIAITTILSSTAIISR